ncbi:acyltransferase family protein [Beijerinckia sp. L45]|uniref:acyltransferase family protein n=1 Tax=Beijerinckia sp. L45 TaxID=1641855 RepID=UPI00131EBB22|nr:acyltransferase family protein [Beijerinckia sp. L45]
MFPTGRIEDRHAIAELKTPDGVFLIQERRAVRREDAKPKALPARGHSASPAMVALGGLIILGVLIGSYTTKYDLAVGHANGPMPVPAVGFLALQLFLARAAYRLFHDIRHVESLGAYVQQRLLRYLPAVVPAVILGFVLLQSGDIPNVKATIEALPANLLMVADMLGVDEVDSAHWRLKIEIFLCLLVGATWFGPLRRHLVAILIIGLSVSAICIDGEPTRQHSLSIRGIVTADGYLPLFAFGIALFQLAEDRTQRVWWGLAAASLVLVFFSNTPCHGAAVVAALATLAAIVAGRLEWLGRARILVVLGELAFPIYVVHFVVGFVLMHRLEVVGIPPVVALAAASAAAIGLGKLFNIAFEKPAEAHLPALLVIARRSLDLSNMLDFLTIADADNTSRAEVPF